MIIGLKYILSKVLMKKVTLRTERSLYTTQTSIGDLFTCYDNKKERFSFTLEDTVRPDNIKVWGYTAIPGGVKCKVKPYTRPNGEETIIFYTESDGITLKWGELSWTYILAHGGNTHEHTDGCLLVAKNKISDIKIQGAMTKELRAFCDKMWVQGYEIEAEFVNLSQLK